MDEGVMLGFQSRLNFVAGKVATFMMFLGSVELYLKAD